MLCGVVGCLLRIKFTLLLLDRCWLRVKENRRVCAFQHQEAEIRWRNSTAFTSASTNISKVCSAEMAVLLALVAERSRGSGHGLGGQEGLFCGEEFEKWRADERPEMKQD
jgi:hypothetical protein